MEISNSIASMASMMKEANLVQSVNTSLMKKTMDITETQAQGIIDMANSIPKFSGDIGQMLDVRA